MKWVLGLILGLITSSCLADTVYIRDIIYVPLRGGQSSEHRILHQGIKSGTRLERLEENEDTGFSRVRTSQGLEGWIQTQYLVTEPIAKDQLADMADKLARLEDNYREALAQLEEASESASSATEEMQQLQDTVTRLESELAEVTNLAANEIQIKQENVRLVAEADQLAEEIDELVKANANLRDSTTQNWYLIGAGTVFGALLLGMLLGRQLFTRKNGGWA